MNEEVWDELCDQRTKTRYATRHIGDLVKRISDLEEGIENLTARTKDHSRELAVNHAAFFELVHLVDRQQERIARLEQIIVGMANDNLVTTYPEVGGIHTHQIYLIETAQTLVEEIEAAAESPPDYLWGDAQLDEEQTSLADFGALYP